MAKLWQTKRLEILCIAALAVIVTIVFNQAFVSGMVFWDDDVFITRNEILKMDLFKAIATTFTSYYHGDYLPLTIMSYWVDTQLFGINWTAYHFTNLLFHIVNCALVYLIVLSIKKDWVWAFFVGLIFAIHPLQAEPVIWISERKSLVSGFFTLLSLYMWLEFLSTDKKKFMFWALALYVCSIMAKTTAILLPVLFFLLDKFYAGKPWKTSFLRLIPVFILIGIIAVLRTISYDYSTPGVVEALWNPNRLQMVPAMAFNAIWFYIEKFFWPDHLSAIYDYFEPGAKAYISAFLTFLGVSGVAWILWKKRRIDSLLFLALFFLFMLPVLHLIPRANFVNDRYMYLPIIGFAYVFIDLLGILAVYSGLEPQRLLTGGMLAALVPMGAQTYQQTKIWDNNLVFWEHTVYHNPTNILARNALGLEYHERRRYEEGRAQFEYVMSLQGIPIALKLKAINNLANIFTDKKYPGYNLAQAAELYKAGIQSSERKNLAYELRINLAQTYALMGRQNEAIAIVKEVYAELKQDPDSRNIWLMPFIERMLGGKPQ